MSEILARTNYNALHVWGIVRNLQVRKSCHKTSETLACLLQSKMHAYLQIQLQAIQS